MNRKNIKKHLRWKVEDWAKSITNKKVAELVRKNTIITGGALVSLLTGEPISDYDIYFKNHQTTKKVAEYYIRKFKTHLKKGNVNRDKTYEPFLETEGNRIKIRIQSAGVISENSDKVDYEYFETLTNGNEIAENYLNRVIEGDEVHEDVLEKDKKSKYRPVFMSQNAITLSDKIQIIVRFCGNPEEIHENFDFVHCTNYYTSWDNKVILKPQALECILNKDLVYEGSLYPLCSVIRTRKFIRRGWKINAGQYLKMLFQVSELDLTDINVLEDQLVGVDSAYFNQFINWCKKRQKEDDSFKLTSPYLASVIDKIF